MEAPASPTRKPLWPRAAKAVLIVGILVFLILYVDPRELAQRFRSADLRWIAIAVALMPLNIYLQYRRWLLVCRHLLDLRQPGDRRRVWRSLLFGIGGGLFTPMKLGELFARAVPFRERRVGSLAFAALVDKTVAQVLVLVFGLVAAVLFIATNPHASEVFNTDLWSILLVLAAVVLAAVLVWLADGKRLKPWLRRQRTVRVVLENLALLKHLRGRVLAGLILLALLFHLTFTIQMSLLLAAFLNQGDFLLYFLIANLIVFTQVVVSPLSLGEIAVREGAAVFYARAYDLSGAAGFNAALFLFVINLVVPSVIGLGYMLESADKQTRQRRQINRTDTG